MNGSVARGPQDLEALDVDEAAKIEHRDGVAEEIEARQSIIGGGEDDINHTDLRHYTSINSVWMSRTSRRIPWTRLRVVGFPLATCMTNITGADGHHSHRPCLCRVAERKDGTRWGGGGDATT